MKEPRARSVNVDSISAYCPTCCHKQRFRRVELDHGFHVVMTVLTCGLWLISWVAVAVGHRFAPWRCKHCGSSDPDFARSVTPPTERKQDDGQAEG